MTCSYVIVCFTTHVLYVVRSSQCNVCMPTYSVKYECEWVSCGLWDGGLISQVYYMCKCLCFHVDMYCGTVGWS